MLRVALALVFALGLGLHAYHLDKVPAHNETIDEYAWAWSGMTLLTDGTPKAWSYLPAYHGVPWQQWRGWGYKLVRPWLDHPPLFSVVMGAWMLAGGFHDILTVELRWMRILPLLLFAANFWLLWILLGKFFDRRDVVLGLLFFSTVPLCVLNTKLVICENWILLVYALTHLAALRWDATRRRWALAATAVGAAALPFSKVAAVGLSLYLLLFALGRKNRPLAAALVGGTLAGTLAYVWWGYHYDWPLFREVMYWQANRFGGFNGAFELLFAHKAVSTRFNYYPFYLSLFFMAAASVDERAREFYLQFFIYIACMTFFVDQKEVYGWYLIPAYPALCMALAQFVRRMVSGAEPWFLLVWAVVVLPYIAQTLTAPHVAVFWLTAARFTYLGVFVAVVAVYWWARRSAAAPRWYPAVAGALVASVVAVDIGWVLTR